MKEEELWRGQSEKVIREVMRTCPLATKAFLSRKFALPQYRAPDYYDQDYVNRISLMMLMLPALPNFQTDDVVQSQLLNLFQALRCDRPTLFLERELGEILIRTEIPGFLETQDIHFPFPSLRVMLPKRLLGLGSQDRWAMYLDIGHLPKDAEVGCPKPIARELDAYGRNGLFRLSRMAMTYPEHALAISAQVDRGLASSYAMTKPLKGTLEAFKSYEGKLHTEFENDPDDNKLLAGMERLALNLLLIFSMTPFEYTPDVIERKAKSEGRRVIPSLVRARWIGDCLVRAKCEGRVQGDIPESGRKIPPHWVRAYWRLQRYGKGNTLRKTIWILPYQTGVSPIPSP